MTTTWTARRATEQRYRLAEGPVWDGVRDRVLWVDIPAGAVHVGTLDDDGTVVPTAVHHVDTTVGAVAVAGDGALLVAGHRCVHLLSASGATTEVARIVPEVERRRLNDGKCDPGGRFQEFGQRLASVIGVEPTPRVDRAGHRHRVGRERVDRADPARGVPAGLRGLGRPAGAVQREGRAARRRVEHEAVPADPGHRRLDHALHGHRRERRVHGVAAGPQDLHGGERRPRV